MASLNASRVKEFLQGFRFAELFHEELGWDTPGTTRPTPFDAADPARAAKPIAQLGGVFVFEIVEPEIPKANERKRIHRVIGQLWPQHVLIFRDAGASVSCWSWVKREGARETLRDH